MSELAKVDVKFRRLYRSSRESGARLYRLRRQLLEAQRRYDETHGAVTTYFKRRSR